MLFSDYMNDWLYAPDGYYAVYREIGKRGDFYTSVSASRFFGGAIANHLVGRIRSGRISRDALICEIGAHRGYLLGDIVSFIRDLEPGLLETLRFGIVEKFEALKKVQREYLTDRFDEKIRLNFYTSLEEIREGSGFVVANEIFDAFPCALIRNGQEAHITDHRIEWIDGINVKTAAIADRYGIREGEIATGYEQFSTSLFNAFERCEFITFDYGDMKPREGFSIRVYSSHGVKFLFDVDLKESQKKSDITYDVHFGHLVDAFREAGFKYEAYRTQMNALTDFGIAELIEREQANVTEDAYLKIVNGVKILLHPSFMGERFKMVSFVK
jgi:SAM-dependent MidA family methyltransferase